MSIIRLRELEPLLVKTREIVKKYEKAAGCVVSVLGPDNQPIDEKNRHKPVIFCRYCKRFPGSTNQNLAKGEIPCALMHLHALEESHHLGGSYIYTCAMGFIFWTSPVYAGKRCAFSLIASGVLAIEKEKAAEKIFQAFCGNVSRKEIEKSLEAIPIKSYNDVKALAQLLVICTKRISSSDNVPIDETARITKQHSPKMHPGKEKISGKIPKPGYTAHQDPSLVKERMLLAALRRGDNEAGKNILDELFRMLSLENPLDFKFFKIKAIELIILFSRAAISQNNHEDNTILATDDRYLKKIEDSKNSDELIETLHSIIDRMSGKIFSFQGIRHASALRKAERFIWENYTRKVSLKEISLVSGLSAPYFSTIFKSEMGENLSCCLNRLRVEKAAVMLIETELSLNKIAAACGFVDQSWFSKMFKNHTGLSPGKYRERSGNYTTIPAGEALIRKEA